ncbi:hypothetical protein [Cryobacterium sp. GrIS_2_6]|uniref:hypothetical protein n=1 Tax=Cryobacterium sp. GrIS_2_6 TaxID=3162785 RepID=UPI002DFCECFC|nr:hypothetical protein [Cryobacterium psychrotolerans]
MEPTTIDAQIAQHLALIENEPNAEPVLRWNGTIHVPKRGWDGVHGVALSKLVQEHVFSVSTAGKHRDRVMEHVDFAVSTLRNGPPLDREGSKITQVTRYLRKTARLESKRNATAFDTGMTRGQVSYCQKAGIPLLHYVGEVDDATFKEARLNVTIPGAHTTDTSEQRDEAESTVGMRALKGVLADARLDRDQVENLLTTLMDELDCKPAYADALRVYQDAPAGDATEAAKVLLIKARGTATETISRKHHLGEAFGLDRSQWAGAVGLIVGSWAGEPGIGAVTDADLLWSSSRLVTARNKLLKTPTRRRK